MEAAGEVDQLASLARSTGDQYAPYVEELISQVAGALKSTVPEISDDQIGAVLMVAANELAKANAARAYTVSAIAVTNAMIILGGRLYTGDAS